MGKADSLETNIVNSIVGDFAITISYVSESVREGNIERDGQPLMRLFEFKNGKISLVREYW